MDYELSPVTKSRLARRIVKPSERTEKFVKRLILTAIAGFVGIPMVIGFVSALNEKEPAPAQAATQVCAVNASALLDLMNQERSKLGAPVLTVDPALSVSAKNKLDDMEKNRYYGHQLLDGSEYYSTIREQGINAAVSEDLDVNSNTADDDWASLKGSPAHYKSLTNPAYTRVGASTRCTDYVLEKSTGPADNSQLIGRKIKSLTVVHLAGPEPTARAASTGSSPNKASTPSASCELLEREMSRSYYSAVAATNRSYDEQARLGISDPFNQRALDIQKEYLGYSTHMAQGGCTPNVKAPALN
jgi:uncharacterized protein YkwD